MDSTAQAMDFSSLDNMFGDMFQNDEQPVKTQPEQKEIPKEEEEELKAKNVENISEVDKDKAIDKLNNITIELNNDFQEREELINNMELALVTGANLLMLGDPGTGKSKITRALCSRIDNATYFEYLLNKTTDPSEILGPISLKEMKNDRTVRNTAGMLPEANIAFIDEVYKSNSAVLNDLLAIMNEHVFHNEGKAVKVPLISMFAASNELPEDDSLAALHDRFLFRIKVNYLNNASSKKKMFQNFIHERAGISNNLSYTTITKDEIKLLQDAAKKVPVPKNILNLFITLLNNLEKNYTIHISDRRANECLKVLQASALIHKRQKVSFDDFKSLIYVLGNNEDDTNTISAEVAKIVNPFDEDYAKYENQFNEIKAKIAQANNDTEKNQYYLENQNALKSLFNRMNKLVSEASANGVDTTRYTLLRDEVNTYNADLAKQVIGDIF